MAFRFPSGSNTFSISFESTGMIVSATRDPAQFPLADYIQYVNTPQRVFRYLKLDLDEPARIVNTQDYAWAPGQDAPYAGDMGAFQYVDSSTVKYAYSWVVPNEAIDQAEWDLDASQMGLIKQKAMTQRTILVASLAQTSTNWPSTNTATASTLNAGAGKWDTASSDPGSANFLAIKKSLTAAATVVCLQTNSTMKWGDLKLVVSPNLAKAMGNSSEIYDYVKGSPDAAPRQKGYGKGSYNVPKEYSDIDIIVEDSVRVTSKPNVGSGGLGLMTSASRAFVWTDATPVLMSRKGGVEGQYGGGSLSTIQLYAYREMEVWTKSDADNERQQGRVVDDIKAVLPFGQSGYCIQQAI